MADINTIVLSGRLVANPDLHYVGEPKVAVCRFSIASDRVYEGKQGQKKTDFTTIIVWRAYGERCANNLSKGQEVTVSGKLQSRNIERSGIKYTVNEIHADHIKFGAKPQ